MNTELKALRLADLIDHGSTSTQIERETANELRRLHSVNAELLEALKNLLVAFPGEYKSAPSHITNARTAIAKAQE